MRNAGGYSIITNPGERDVEHDTFSCAHCGAITFTKPGNGPVQVAVMRADGSVYMREVTRCFTCFEYICPRCEGKACVPKLKWVEEEERKSKLILDRGDV